MSRSHRPLHLPRFPFFKTLLLSLTALILVFAGLAFLLLPTSESHRNEYQQILATANPLITKNSQSPYTASQVREGIAKDYFFTRNCQRMQLHLDGQSAILELEQLNKHSFLVEHIRNISCHMHEELFYKLSDGREATLLPSGQLALRQGEKSPLSSEETRDALPMQAICYLKASKATYHYSNGALEAEDAAIWRYVSEGHTLPSLPPENINNSMRAIADKLELNMQNGEPHFKATGFQGFFQSSCEV